MIRVIFSLTAAILMVVVLSGCGGGQKTPSDIKDTVAWLDGRSALPVFPFGTNPLYIFVHSDRSPVCSSMIRLVFSRPEIIEYMNKHLTSISVKPEGIGTVEFMGQELTSADLIRILKVQGYPAHYFFNSAGELKGFRMGYIPLKEFKQLLKYMVEGYVEKFNFQTFLQMEESRLDTVYGEF